MKLKDFANHINALISERPELGEAEVVTSSDDEGNDFHRVFYTPTAGHYSEDEEFSPEGQDCFGDQDMTTNTVCIN